MTCNDVKLREIEWTVMAWNATGNYMKSNELACHEIKSHELTWKQIKLNELKWLEHGITWHELKLIEIIWNERMQWYGMQLN